MTQLHLLGLRLNTERPLQISTISFDGDMTLWDFRKVMRDSLKHTLVEMQRRIPTPRVLKFTVDYEITSLTEIPAILGMDGEI